MSDIKVSIISPVYQVDAYLDDYLDSMCAQDMESLEIVCVDDGGSDGSMELIRARALTDPRIVIVESDENVGAGAARNKGLAQARGEYVGFVDPDDKVSPGYCRSLYEEGKRSGADIVKCHLRRFRDEDSTIERTTRRLDEIARDVSCGIFPIRFCGSQYVSCLYRRSFLNEGDSRGAIRFPERDACRFTNGEDDVFLLRCLLRNPGISIVFDSSTAYLYRRRGGSLTTAYSEMLYRGIILSRVMEMEYLNLATEFLTQDEYYRIADRFLSEIGAHYRMYRSGECFDRLRYISGLSRVFHMIERRGDFERTYFRSYFSSLKDGDLEAVAKHLDNSLLYYGDKSIFRKHFLYRMLFS